MALVSLRRMFLLTTSRLNGNDSVTNLLVSTEGDFDREPGPQQRTETLVTIESLYSIVRAATVQSQNAPSFPSSFLPETFVTGTHERFVFSELQSVE